MDQRTGSVSPSSTQQPENIKKIEQQQAKEKDKVDQASKQDQPKIKKQSSYTYWVTGKSQFKQQNAPKKIEEHEEKKLVQTKPESKGSSSAWNSGGTWEHKTLKNDQVQSKLLLKIQKLFNPNQKYQFELIDIIQFTGETTVLVSRGKAKIGFDYKSIQFSWKGKSSGKIPDTQGTIKVKNLADDDPDQRSVVFKVKKTPDGLDQKEVKGFIKKTASAIVDPLITAFKDLVENKI